MKIELTDKWENITEAHRSTWNKAYPAIDLDQELAKAKAWIDANPKNRKSNYDRYLNNWFSKAQDKAPKIDNTHALDMLKKAQDMFISTHRQMEERLRVTDRNLEEIRADIHDHYKTVEDFVTMMQNYYKISTGVQSKKGFAYEKFVKFWKIGGDIWGKDTLKNLWNKKNVVS